MTRTHTDIRSCQKTDGHGFIRIRIPVGFVSVFLLISLWIAGPGLAAEDPSGPVKFDGRYLTIDAKDVVLDSLIQDIRNACGVEITGLENRVDDPVTIAVEKRTPETVFKRLLRQLGEENYAFEFSHSKLKKVSVFPDSNFKGGSQAPYGFSGGTPSDPATVVEIQSIVPDSQAEEADLRPGDIVVEYDGAEISRSQELIREVKRKKEMDRVELKVMRDGVPVSVMLRGGLIGIRINTKRIGDR